MLIFQGPSQCMYKVWMMNSKKYTQSGANNPNIFSQFLLHSTTISYKYHVDSTLLGVGSSVHKHSQRNSISIYTLPLYHNILSPYTCIQIDEDPMYTYNMGRSIQYEVSLRFLVTLPGKRLRFSAYNLLNESFNSRLI